MGKSVCLPFSICIMSSQRKYSAILNHREVGTDNILRLSFTHVLYL